MAEPDHPSTPLGVRTPSDVASLLMEVGRAVRGLSFYPEGDPAGAELVDRAWWATSAELSRAGPLALRLVASGFRADGVPATIPPDHLEDLAEALRRHEVTRVQLSPSVSRDALQALLELLVRAAEPVRRAGGLARALSARCSTGISLDPAGGDAPRPEPPAPAAPLDPTEGLALAPAPAGPGPRRRASASASAGDDEKPDLDARPLEAPAHDPRGDRLRLRLVELDRCPDDGAYEFLATRIAEAARELFDAGLSDECHRTLLVLADHAVGEGGRSGLQARVAHRLCTELARGPRLDALIDRARARETGTRVRATQVLLLLGEHAIPAVFERYAERPEGDDGAQLAAILIALGDAAIRHLMGVIAAPDDTRAALAIRLAGELQHPAMVAPVVAALEGDRGGLRGEAARTLARLGGDEAVHALVNALSSGLDGLPETAAHWLGATGDPRAVQPLLAALERATRRPQDGGARARAIIRALGALGSERAVPRLVALLERRALLRRKAFRQLRVCALSALDALPGREARRAVERARRHGDPAVRARAEALLAEAIAREAARDA